MLALLTYFWPRGSKILQLRGPAQSAAINSQNTPWNSCGFEPQGHKFKFQGGETMRKKGEQLAQSHTEGAEWKQGKIKFLHFPNRSFLMRPRARQDEHKTLLIPIWKVQVFTHLHEQDLI